MLTKDEKEFLKMATQRYIEEVNTNIRLGKQFLEFATEEKYVEFLENIIKKLS